MTSHEFLILRQDQKAYCDFFGDESLLATVFALERDDGLLMSKVNTATLEHENKVSSSMAAFTFSFIDLYSMFLSSHDVTNHIHAVGRTEEPPQRVVSYQTFSMWVDLFLRLPFILNTLDNLLQLNRQMAKSYTQTEREARHCVWRFMCRYLAVPPDQLLCMFELKKDVSYILSQSESIARIVGAHTHSLRLVTSMMNRLNGQLKPLTPLWHALWEHAWLYHDVRRAQAILECVEPASVPVTKEWDDMWYNILCQSVVKDQASIVRFLLQSARNDAYRIGLRLDPARDESLVFRNAVRLGHFHVVQALLEDGQVDPAACKNDALRWALITADIRLVQCLLYYDCVTAEIQEDASLRKRVECVLTYGVHRHIRSTCS